MSQVLHAIDNYDKPKDVHTERQYVGTGRYKNKLTKKTGERIPKTGFVAEIGVGRAVAERSVFQAEARGPGASIQAEINPLGTGAVAQTTIGSAALSAGPLEFKAGLEATVGAHLNAQTILDIVDYYDRPGFAYTEGLYANTDTYAYGGTNKTGERIPKAGAIAEAGVGRASAGWSIFQAVAKGPNASAGAHANVLGVNAMARAELGSATASAGLLRVTAGLGLDTGVSIGAEGVEVKFLGTGIKIGEGSVGVSCLGNEVKCAII